MAKNDGGLAFPALDDSGTGLCLRESGMTVRDYAAIHAEAPWAVVAEQLYNGLGHKSPTFDQMAEGMATLRYKMADAMLAERAK